MRFLSIPIRLPLLLWVLLVLVLIHSQAERFAVAAAQVGSSTSGEKSEEGNLPTSPPPDFFFACSGGQFDVIRTSLEQHPSWVNSRTQQGESCLHLTGIYGHSQITRLLLVNGADPNIRSTYEEGLRMHPLSWNVYGGHYDNVQLLLEYGADVNLDFDGMGSSRSSKGTDEEKNDVAVTALDIAIALTKNEQDVDERFVKIEQLLRKHGGITIEEVRRKKSTEESDHVKDDEL